MGVTALMAAPIALRQVTPDGWLAVWLAEALIAATIALVTMHYKATRLGTQICRSPDGGCSLDCCRRWPPAAC